MESVRTIRSLIHTNKRRLQGHHSVSIRNAERVERVERIAQQICEEFETVSHNFFPWCNQTGLNYIPDDAPVMGGRIPTLIPSFSFLGTNLYHS